MLLYSTPCRSGLDVMNHSPPLRMAFGTARFAAGEVDAVNLDSGASVLFYRIIRLR